MAYTSVVGWSGISESVTNDGLIQFQDPVICGVLIAAFGACLAYALLRRMLS